MIATLSLRCVLERRIHLNTNEFKEENQEVEIDLKALFLKIRSLWYVVILGALTGIFVSVLYGKLMTAPMYSASSMVYLRSSSQSISLQDLQLGSELTKDYEIIFKSRPNLENVIADLDLDMSVGQLSGMIAISNPTDTRILQVSVTSEDPDLSASIVNEVVENGMQTVREIDSQEPYVVERAIPNTTNVGTSLLHRAILGGLVGLVIAIGLICLRFILTDSITSVDDVEEVLGIPVLAVVVEDRNLSYAKKNNRRK